MRYLVLAFELSHAKERKQRYDDDLLEEIQKINNKKIITDEIRSEHQIMSALTKHLREQGVKITKNIILEEKGTLVLRIPKNPSRKTCLLEIKSHGFFKDQTNIQKSISNFLIDHLENYASKDKRDIKGILFDGVKIIFIDWDKKNENWKKNVKNFDKNTLFSLNKIITETIKKQASLKSLEKDFGFSSATTKKTVVILFKKLIEALSTNTIVKELYFKWDKTFKFMYGRILENTAVFEDFIRIARQLNLPEDNFKPEQLLFVLFTFYSIIVKLIAAEIIGTVLDLNPITISSILLDTENLLISLKSIDTGLFFKQNLGIENYYEQEFFSWFLETWNKELEEAIRELLDLLNNYNPYSFVENELITKDLLKTLYQSILPNKIRHDLGEYYTPDWLIELVLNEVNYNGDPEKKILDPGCGSGSFLVEIINRIKKLSLDKELKNVSNHELLTKILNNVIGFDINPVAILTAKTNYLFSILYLIKNTNTKKINIPIYLLDVFSFSPINRSEQKNSVRESSEKKFFQKEKNTALIQNKQKLFITKFKEAFDFVVGNPPWVKWEFLSKEYREKLKQTYLEDYSLFSYKGMKAGLGYSHDDISIIFTYVVIDKFLKDKGKLGFILKQTLYKSIAGKEFRTFEITKKNTKIPLKVLVVHDLLKLTPFKLPGAETSLIVISKGEKNKYPIKYVVWQLKNKDSAKRISFSSSLTEIRSIVKLKNLFAFPASSDPTDIWVLDEKRERSFTSIAKSQNPYEIRHGVVNDLNNVFFLDILGIIDDKHIIVKNSINRGKKKVREITMKIEKDLIYPVIKPRHVKKWRVNGYYYMLLPQSKAGENNEKQLKISFPNTYNYLSFYKEALLQRSSRWFKDKVFYSLFGIGEYTFKSFKVVWCPMKFPPEFAVVSKVKDKYLGEKILIPDNTIAYIPLEKELEAHYLCAILNSSIINQKISRLSSKSKWAVSIKTIKNMPIPKFDINNSLHIKLAKLSVNIHEIIKIDENNELISGIEKRIDFIAQKILAD